MEISEHFNFKYSLSCNILVSKIYFFASQNSYEKPNSKLPNRSKPAQISDYVSQKDIPVGLISYDFAKHNLYILLSKGQIISE